MTSPAPNGQLPMSARRSSAMIEMDPNTEIFGLTLSKAMSLDEGRTLLASQEIPTLLDLILCNLEINAMDAEVFVNSDPDSAAVSKLRDSLNRGTLPLTITGQNDVVAGLLRRYLLELPEPLVPVTFFKPLLAALTSSKRFKNGKDRGGVAVVKELVESTEFPRVNYHALRRVCNLLRGMLTSWWSESTESNRVVEVMSLNIMRPDNLKRAASSSKEMGAIKDAVSNLVTHSMEIFVRRSPMDSNARRVSMIQRGERASRHQLLEAELETSASGATPESGGRTRRLSSYGLYGLSSSETPRFDNELRAEFKAFKESTNNQIHALTETIEALRAEVASLKRKLSTRDYNSDAFASAHSDLEEDVSEESDPPSPAPPKRSSSSQLASEKKSSSRSLECDTVERKSSKSSIDATTPTSTKKKDSKKHLNETEKQKSKK